ncbi:MAG: hypothetical protein JKY52_14725 [Flavobacteriales bacterium]|nr:hypothetical protein [Flavobacteriales bacterium]
MQVIESNRVSFKKDTATRCISVLFLVAMLSSCSLFQDDSESSKPVVRVFDTYLYQKDINALIALGTTPGDSATLVTSYLESWVKQQLVLNKAKLNLSEEETFNSIEKQLEDYRTSLIIYAYQKELVKQRLDTVVSEQEIVDYYRDNANNLILKDDIVRVRYLKISKGAPDLKKARAWCASEEVEDHEALEEYCHQYANSFYLLDKEWILLENLTLELGQEFQGNQEQFKPEALLEVEDSLNLYLIYVLDRIKKDQPAPVEYERKKIIDIILNRRRSELIINMEASAYKEGVRNKYFEFYK